MASKKNKKKPKLRPDHLYISNPENFFNREISWLRFNERVLSEAMDTRNPLLERLRFIEIYIGNLDEFVMKRVGRLKSQIEASVSFTSHDGLSPTHQLALIRQNIMENNQRLAELFNNAILPGLAEKNIYLLQWKDLKDSEKKHLKEFYLKNIFPILTPLAVDFGHPFPFISNLSKSLGVRLRKPEEKEDYFSRIKIPKELPKWIRCSSDSTECRFIGIDELIKHNIEELFRGMNIKSVHTFRITRSAEWDQDSQAEEDIMEMVEEELKERKFNPIVRLEHDLDIDPWILEFLKDELSLIDDEIYPMPSLPNYSAFTEILNLDRPELKFEPWIPKVPKDFTEDNINIFSLIKKQDYLFHHPFDSFSSTVERFIKDAAKDPLVLAIKMTLYRTGENSQIGESLMLAAENGKQVVCLVELKARFEEERNIRWAQRLEGAGVHVVYGMTGLKTHCKMAMVVRKEADGIRTFCHFGSGNYNSLTSRFYTDFGLLTSNEEICSEAVEVFNFLTGRSLKKDYQSLLIAPVGMKKRFIELIKKEEEYVKTKGEGLIIAKMNQLEDVEIINALYSASKAGVKVHLIIRGFCCLIPGKAGLSENITVSAIIGRFLEHTRIFYFSAGKADRVDGAFYFGSADWMHRNLDSRVEVIVPIVQKSLKQRTWDLLDLYIREKRQAWDLDQVGYYTKREKTPKADDPGIHAFLMKNAQQEKIY
jgi:polyphosphate kinase